jgi:phosphoesterase RecJ-like protein
MTSLPELATSDLERVGAELRSRDRFLLTAHEGPDGDALGSLLGLHKVLTQLGKDSVMFMAAKEFPLPIEYRFLPLEEVFHEAPADMADRTVVFLDCGNLDRMPVEWLTAGGNDVINIDHHHDNTRFGDVNLVVADASCTAEIVYALAQELGAEVTPEIAEALYIALVTDTGRFQYSSTTPKALRLAADLVEAGADVHHVFRQVYENVDFAKLKLLARVLERAQVYEGGRVVISYVLREDFGQVGAEEPYSEGLIDYLRSVEGAQLVALIREPPREEGPARRISLRSSADEIDVSAIARASGGGGHPQAAGFSSEQPIDEIVAFILRGFRAAVESG